eukprot:TRINITY_DN3541_c0_g1_i20.p1 TRINITY_DN3541_c0_g1~~TRINITY_DN3541_c0_g1_i20.p1  ORF type:complete len:303 (+),score=47.12 TRINITY_DN3541_c0_g1_i20:206-1114(+)
MPRFLIPLVGETAFTCDHCAAGIEPSSIFYTCWDCACFVLCEECWKLKKTNNIYQKKEGRFSHNSTHTFYSQIYQRSYAHPGTTVCETLMNAFLHYSTSPALGFRKKKSSGFGNYKWITYEELSLRCMDFATGLLNITQLKKGSFVGICGEHCLEWYITDFSYCFCKYVIVPMHTNLDSEQLEFILKDANIECVTCTSMQVEKILEASSRCPNLKFLIVIGKLPNGTTSLLTVINFSEVEQHGRTLIKKNKGMKVINVPLNSPTNIFSLSYTSGSTGFPKGVIKTDMAYNNKGYDNLRNVIP